MNKTIRAWAILAAATALALLPLTANAANTAGVTPDAVATHGGWVCVNWPVHVCVP